MEAMALLYRDICWSQNNALTLESAQLKYTAEEGNHKRMSILIKPTIYKNNL